MQKIINPGSMPAYNRRGDLVESQIYCKIEYKQSEEEIKELRFRSYGLKHKGSGRLSISGVVGPLANGDCRGSCGQISSTIRDAIKDGEFTPNAAQGWTVPDVLSFLDLWDRYHLNDMKPECEHQRAAGWPEMARIEIKSYTFRLLPAISSQKKALEAEAIERAASIEKKTSVGFSPLERKILKLEQFITLPVAELGELARFYEPTTNSNIFPPVKSERRGWVRFDQDDRGLLCKPCETCGYKYGSAWQLMKLSPEILHTFEALPETNTKPAWV